MVAQAAPGAPGRSDRIPPYSEDAERGVLGSALLDAARIVDLCVERQLTPESFYVPAHQKLFEVMVAMAQDSRPIDLLTVPERLRELGLLDEIGGSVFLERLVDDTPTSAHAEYYIDIVSQKFLLRAIINRSRESIDLCYSSEEEAHALLGRVEQSFFDIADEQRANVIPWHRLVKTAMSEIENIFLTKKGITGIPTGYSDMDRVLLGLHAGDMFILAARPSMGKTSLALNIAENIALGKGDNVPRPVAVFSLEMSAESLVRRMICSHARVPAHRLSGGFITPVNHGLLIQAADALMKAPLYLDDSAGLDVMELRSRARRLKRKYDIQLIVVDYLQMLNCTQFAKEGRQREVSAISGGLKAMAKELKIPVLVLSQLNRAPETRDKVSAVPKLADLRDSGSIEQDADVVGLLRRPCRYPGDQDSEDKTLAILEIAKHRNGPVGRINLNFDEECTRFDNRASGVDQDTQGEPGSGGAEA
ncbi:MAG: replicative DNA helicase [Lentisphaerota bacterium]